MIPELWACIFSALFFYVDGAKLPEPEVKIEVLYKPFLCHRKSKYGDILLVHYEGFLESNGTMFHSSRHHGDKNPVWFTLGIREVIKGWDKGLQGMCKIPPESTLIFDIEIIEIRNGPRSHESFQEMDLNDDWKLSKAEVKEYLRKEFERHGYAANDTHHEVMVEDIFQKEDEDNDGFISAREFTYKHDEL
ncbi:hypothetical protein cypCar_00026276 [Cyprinus carpio]|nr:hypothetical protein cypCar_00026276 [Cyprinus carpio]